MNKLLIAPAEAAVAAFPESPEIGVEYIGEALILSAQQRFLEPVFNGLYEAVVAGQHGGFFVEYLKAPLALYIRYLALPALRVQVGAAGVVRYGGSAFSSAGTDDLTLLRRSLLHDAGALIDIAVHHVESRPDDYPEYNSDANVRNRLRICGGMVL